MKIEIKTGNAAFHAAYEYDEAADNYIMANELKHIFSSICNHIKVGRTEGVLMDSYGNKVGEWRL